MPSKSQVLQLKTLSMPKATAWIDFGLDLASGLGSGIQDGDHTLCLQATHQARRGTTARSLTRHSSKCHRAFLPTAAVPSPQPAANVKERKEPERPPWE